MDFQLLTARDLDIESGHTAYHRASLINLHLHAKFIEIEETSYGRTDIWDPL